MARYKFGAAVLLTAFAVAAQPARAQFPGPLPSNAYIVVNGLDWAWAYPWAATAGQGFTLAGESAYGWALPTAGQLLNAPLGAQFLFAGGNVPFDGADPVSGGYFNNTDVLYTTAQSAGACAAAYFGADNWCDWGNGLGDPNNPNITGLGWAGMPGANIYSDQLVVRVDAGSVVPEPATMTLMATGLVGLMGAGLRRRKKA